MVSLSSVHSLTLQMPQLPRGQRHLKRNLHRVCLKHIGCQCSMSVVAGVIKTSGRTGRSFSAVDDSRLNHLVYRRPKETQKHKMRPRHKEACPKSQISSSERYLDCSRLSNSIVFLEMTVCSRFRQHIVHLDLFGHGRTGIGHGAEVARSIGVRYWSHRTKAISKAG